MIVRFFLFQESQIFVFKWASLENLELKLKTTSTTTITDSTTLHVHDIFAVVVVVVLKRELTQPPPR